jgi:hypothetical protein
MPTRTRPKTSVWIDRMRRRARPWRARPAARGAPRLRARQQRQRQAEQRAEQRAEGGDADRRPGRLSRAREVIGLDLLAVLDAQQACRRRCGTRAAGCRTRRRGNSAGELGAVFSGWRAGCAPATARRWRRAKRQAGGDQQQVAEGEREKAAAAAVSGPIGASVPAPGSSGLQLAGGQSGVANRLVEGVVAADESRCSAAAAASAASSAPARPRPARPAAGRRRPASAYRPADGDGVVRQRRRGPDDLRILGADQTLLDHRVAVAVVVGASIEHALR